VTVPPQPNPVGFVRDGGDSLLAYSQAGAARLANIRRQPLVSLNFDSDGGEDIVVLTGTAEILDGYPAVPGNPAWLQKSARPSTRGSVAPCSSRKGSRSRSASTSPASAASDAAVLTYGTRRDRARLHL